MARRRFHRSKTSPDMGWIVDTVRYSFPAVDVGGSEGAGGAIVRTLFDFADVDAEALTGRIEQDKSDWFVKRFIVDCFAAVSFENATPTDTARLWALGLGVIPDNNATDIDSNHLSVYGPEATNLYARTFRTYVRPVYAAALIPYTAEFAVAVPGSSGGNPESYGVTSTPWGPSMVRDDFEVSNAGLRNNQAVSLHVSLEPGPAGFTWDIGDQLYISMAYRALLQKRR